MQKKAENFIEGKCFFVCFLSKGDQLDLQKIGKI
jgi:hypothetical protein